MDGSSNLRAGDWVEVRSKEEILQTLDVNSCLEGLPFMPEMFAFCGKQFQVSKRAHKTCDPPNGLLGRRMPNAVHLDDLRCDGAAHGGCQHNCLIFWKEQWLKPSTAKTPANTGCTDQQVFAAAWRGDANDPVYVCQNTQVHAATQPLHWWDLRQYLEDYASGNVRISQIIASLSFFIWHTLAGAGLGIGSAVRWSYDAVQKLRGGVPYPWRRGQVPKGAKTPSHKLDLQPGELVRVKSYPEILATLDENGNNRGMWFDAEMVPFCGKTFRVRARVNRIINEQTGKMMHLKNECIMLQDVVCHACYAKFRKFCPRAIYAYWREIWLERVEPPQRSH